MDTIFNSNEKTREVRGKKITDVEFKIENNDITLININTKDMKDDCVLSYVKNDKYGSEFEIDDDKYKLSDLFLIRNSKRGKYKMEFGYVIIKNEIPTAIISIYEPHGAFYDNDFELITVHGHEEVVNVKVPSLKWKKIYTR